jgi:hypothetical protein
MRCASPPESDFELRLKAKYSKPTFIKKSSVGLNFFDYFSSNTLLFKINGCLNLKPCGQVRNIHCITCNVLFVDFKELSFFFKREPSQTGWNFIHEFLSPSFNGCRTAFVVLIFYKVRSLQSLFCNLEQRLNL